MASYDYAVAKDVLNEADKNRVLCIWLNSNVSNTDWTKAANDFGSASVESFRVTTRNMLKKLEKSGAKRLDIGDTAESPVKVASKRGTGKKQKIKTEAEDATEKPKRGRGRPKKNATPVTDSDADDGDEAAQSESDKDQTDTESPKKKIKKSKAQLASDARLMAALKNNPC